MFRIASLAVPACLMLVACGQPSTPAAQSVPAAPVQPVAEAPEVQPAETPPVAESEGPIRVFTALGGKDAEATWRVVVEDERLTLSGKQLPVQGSFDAERSAYAKGVEFSGELEGMAVMLNIHGQACPLDGLSFEFSATLDIADQTWRGCAMAGLQVK